MPSVCRLIPCSSKPSLFSPRSVLLRSLLVSTTFACYQVCASQSLVLSSLRVTSSAHSINDQKLDKKRPLESPYPELAATMSCLGRKWVRHVCLHQSQPFCVQVRGSVCINPRPPSGLPARSVPVPAGENDGGVAWNSLRSSKQSWL